MITYNILGFKNGIWQTLAGGISSMEGITNKAMQLHKSGRYDAIRVVDEDGGTILSL